VRDRVAQAAASHALSPVFEAEYERCSFGYRAGRGVRDAVNAIRKHYERGYRWVLDADIDAYFENVDHELLEEKLVEVVGDRREVKLLERWIRAHVWDGSQVYRLRRGIPQGSVVSPAFANLLLDRFDEAMLAAGFRVVRYADDFVVLCKDRPHAERAARLTDEVMDTLRLRLDEADIVSFDSGFTFLGVTFVRSLATLPFDRPKHDRKVVFMPPPMNPDEVRRWQDSYGRRPPKCDGRATRTPAPAARAAGRSPCRTST
jgi:group II intron reverse transcriptase/maturase